MTPAGCSPIRLPRRSRFAVACVAAFVALCGLASAQGPGGAPRPAVKAAVSEQGARWSELKPAQQATLKPLEREWPALDASSKQKWVEISARFPKLTPTEQSRIQDRMAAWARLTPRERGDARVNFQEAKQLPREDREARWKAYEALTPEQRARLAARAAPQSAPDPVRRRAAAEGKSPRDGAPETKSNLVPSTLFVAPPKTVAPTVVQARPGATTMLITRRPAPPDHQQVGMPKIAATPGFVDKSTLLPQRGPQGAATRSSLVPEQQPAAPAPRP